MISQGHKHQVQSYMFIMLCMNIHTYIHTYICLHLGEKISSIQAEKRRKQYTVENLGNFVYYGIKNVCGKSIW